MMMMGRGELRNCDEILLQISLISKQAIKDHRPSGFFVIIRRAVKLRRRKFLVSALFLPSAEVPSEEG
jgi:hypothetical protein